MAIDRFTPVIRTAPTPAAPATQAKTKGGWADTSPKALAKDALILSTAAVAGHALKTVALAGTTAEATSFFNPRTDAARAQIAEELAEVGITKVPRFKVDWTSYVKEGSKTVHLNHFKFSPILRKGMQGTMADTSFMHLVRHETGHVVGDAAIRRKLVPKFSAVFGSAKAEYDVSFWTQLTAGFKYRKSADFVSKYAQTHPMEDFAETFGVYLRLGGKRSAIKAFVAESGGSAALLRKFNVVDDVVKLAGKIRV
jgi:hypothetical protein